MSYKEHILLKMSKTSHEIKEARPISPHLTIYKPQISSMLSIGHRTTGTCMYFAFLIISWWFIGWVFSKFDPIYLEYAKTPIAKLLLVLTSYAFFYHFCTGIRHLFWDMGMGFKIKQVNSTGWLAVIMSVVLTTIFWIMLN